LVYLRQVTADAAGVMARHYRGIVHADDVAHDIRPRAWETLRESVLTRARPRLHVPDPQAPTPTDEPADITVYVDGSYSSAARTTPACAGWGCFVIGIYPTPSSYCGPICLGQHVDPQCCIDHLSNSVAELCALLNGLRIALHNMPGSTVRIVYDNRYAANITFQLRRPRENTPLVRALCAVAARATAHGHLRWQWVRGHSGIYGKSRLTFWRLPAVKVVALAGFRPCGCTTLLCEVLLMRHCPSSSCTTSCGQAASRAHGCLEHVLCSRLCCAWAAH
jgi:ribonuclease HI